MSMPPSDSTAAETAAAETELPASPAPSTKAQAAVATTTVAAAAAAAVPPKSQPAAKCRVWTASYGGQKSVIIRSNADQLVNFTVLDVNEGQENRETEAYISAYAKGGQKIGDFSNQGSALEKAFQLCPEG
mgnify:CR=1 FL=1